jgi:hypothetical protein
MQIHRLCGDWDKYVVRTATYEVTAAGGGGAEIRRAGDPQGLTLVGGRCSS